MKFPRLCFEEIKEFLKSSLKSSKISTTSWWQRFRICVHSRDADGLRPDPLTSLQRFWCFQIFYSSSKFPVIHKALSSAFPSLTSPCLHQIDSFRLLHTLDSKIKMKDLLFCLRPFVVSCAAGESDLSTPTLKTWRLKQVMWLGPSNKVSPVPWPSQVLQIIL